MDLLKRIQDLSDIYDDDGPSAMIPESRPMFNDGGMLVQPSNDGSRPGYKGKKPLTGEKFVEIVEKFPDYSNKQLLNYFNKNKFTNRSGDPLTTGAIKTQKSKFFDLAAEKKSQVPKGYVSSAEVFENLPISKADYFRVKQAKEGGTLLTQEIDKLLKPQKVGPQQFYFKKPSKSDMKSFLRLSDKTGRLDNRIADLMIDFDKAYGKSFAKGIIPTLEDVTNKFNITDSTAGKVTTRLAQWYGGQDFKNPQLKDLKRNKVSSNRMFKTIEKSAFGNPYRDGLYQISMQTIDSKLGNKQGTFEKFKSQAKQILKDNNIPIYDPKMGKNAFGFNINEIAGVTGSAKSKAAEFSQFVDVMEGNINTKAMAGFQSKLSTARQNIEAAKGTKNYKSVLSSESKRINDMAKNLEKTYEVELPRLQDPDATKYFSPKRLNELKTQGLDIVKAAERAGYTIQMPKSAQTITEFIDKPDQIRLAKIGCPGKANGGRIGFNEGLNVIRCAVKGVEKLQGDPSRITPGDKANIKSITKTVQGGRMLKNILGPAALAYEGFFALPFAAYDYASGRPGKDIAKSALSLGFLDEKLRQDELKKIYPEYGQIENLQNIGERIDNLERLQSGTKGQRKRSGFKLKKAKEEFNLAAEPYLKDPNQLMMENIIKSQEAEKQLQKEYDIRSQGRKTDPFIDPFQAAGGGIAKMAGDRSGPPPQSGPTPQGLQGLFNRVKKI